MGEKHEVAERINDARTRLLEGLSLTERQAEVGGVPTVLLEGGDGPPLLLLHGGNESGGAYWAPVISQLAGRHRLVVPDVPGLGESGRLPRLDAGSFAEWFAGVIQLTCDEKPSVIAHSLVGSLAARFTAYHSAMLRRLMLYGVPGIGPYRMPLGLVVTALRYDLRPTLHNLERFDRWAILDLEETRLNNPGWYEAFDDYNLAQGRRPDVKRTMRLLVRTASKRVPEAELASIGIPTVLVWGRHDRMVPLHLAEEASAKFGWPLNVIEGAGHVPHMEQPDEFVRALQGALLS